MSISKKVKDIVKHKVAPESKFGTNPKDPWSAKANIAEASNASLSKYLMSRGINPDRVSKNTMIAHSKSSEFKKWSVDHQFEEIEIEDEQLEESSSALLDKYLHSRGYNPMNMTKDQKIAHSKTNEFKTWSYHHAGMKIEDVQLSEEDIVRLNVPLLIRIMELSREEIKSDADLHKVVERILKRNSKNKLTMDDYKFISGLKEELQIEDYDPKTKKVKEPTPGEFDSMVKRVGEKAKKQGPVDIKKLAARLNAMRKEDVYQDPQAATQTVFDGANNTDDTCSKKNQTMKSARMIKSLYKKHRAVKEELYDQEKEDKSVASYGKKPKMKVSDKEDSFGEKKPEAAATVTGGTTLTGCPRDTIEIDPMMRVRPGQPDPTNGKKSGKEKEPKNDK